MTKPVFNKAGKTAQIKRDAAGKAMVTEARKAGARVLDAHQNKRGVSAATVKASRQRLQPRPPQQWPETL
jgi:hypothetical protein